MRPSQADWTLLPRGSLNAAGRSAEQEGWRQRPLLVDRTRWGPGVRSPRGWPFLKAHRQEEGKAREREKGGKSRHKLMNQYDLFRRTRINVSALDCVHNTALTTDMLAGASCASSLGAGGCHWGCLEHQAFLRKGLPGTYSQTHFLPDSLTLTSGTGQQLRKHQGHPGRNQTD